MMPLSRGFKLLPTVHCRLLPTPYSLLPTPYSLLPTPYSLQRYSRTIRSQVGQSWELCVSQM